MSDQVGQVGSGSGAGGALGNLAFPVPAEGRTITPLVAASNLQSKSLGTYLFNNRRFNVKDYGAKGDGTADDTAAVQAAVNAAAAVNGLAYLPSGLYNISATITLPTAVALVGDGMWLSRLQQTVTPVPGSQPNSATPFDAIQILGSNVMVANLACLGPSAGFPAIEADNKSSKGLTIQPAATCSNITLENLYIAGWPTTGMMIWNGVRYVDCKNLIIQNCGNEGLYITYDVGYVQIRGLQVLNTRSWAFDNNAGRVHLSEFILQQCGDPSQLFNGGGITWAPNAGGIASTFTDDVTYENGVVESFIGVGAIMYAPTAAGTIARGFNLTNVKVIFNSAYTARINLGAGIFIGNNGGGAQLGRLEGANVTNCHAVQCNIQCQSSSNLIFAGCTAFNSLAMPADPDQSTQGFRMDPGNGAAFGSIIMQGCVASGWHRGVFFLSGTHLLSIGNIAHDNDTQGFNWPAGLNVISIGDYGYGNPAGNDFILNAEALSHVFGARGQFSNAGNPDGQNNSRNIRPAADATYNLGNSTFGWATLFLSQFGSLKINNIQVVGPQIAGWGTPTGGGIIANFPGATATLAQCSQEIAQIILSLKAHGLFGA